jgi:hypothetical protein
MRCYLLSALLLSITSLRSAAQAPPAVPEYPRFFVGASCMLGNYGVRYPRIRNYEEPVLSPAITVGYQIFDRLAVQVSAEKSRNILVVEVNRLNQTHINYYRDERHNFAIPVVLRFAGTRRPAKRLQFDALAGVVLIHASYQWIQDGYDDFGNITFHEEHAEQTTNMALSLGGGIRYRFGRRLEAVADANLNLTLGAAAPGGFVNVYTMGLRYRFGPH